MGYRDYKNMLSIPLWDNFIQEVIMLKARRFMLSLAVTAAVLLAAPSVTPALAAEEVAQVSVVQFPAVQLKDWKNSTQGEKNSFLIGFLSLMALEGFWQGMDPLPIEQSTINAWVRGLSDVSLRDMANTVDAYIAAHPQNMNMGVIEVLGQEYVTPKLSKSERDKASARVQTLQTQIPK